MLEPQKRRDIVILIVESLFGHSPGFVVYTNHHSLVIKHHQITARQVYICDSLLIDDKDLLAACNVDVFIKLKLPLSVGSIWIFNDTDTPHQYASVAFFFAHFSPTVMTGFLEQCETLLFVSRKPCSQGGAVVFAG